MTGGGGGCLTGLTTTGASLSLADVMLVAFSTTAAAASHNCCEDKDDRSLESRLFPRRRSFASEAVLDEVLAAGNDFGLGSLV